MVSVSSDKTLVCRQPDGRGLTVGTIPHPVIGLIGDPVMADSFPMAGKYFFMHWLLHDLFTFVKHFSDQNVICTWFKEDDKLETEVKSEHNAIFARQHCQYCSSLV